MQSTPIKEHTVPTTLFTHHQARLAADLAEALANYQYEVMDQELPDVFGMLANEIDSAKRRLIASADKTIDYSTGMSEAYALMLDAYKASTPIYQQLRTAKER